MVTAQRRGYNCLDVDSTIKAQALLADIRAGRAPAILDVRSDAEYDQGHVPGARHVPFWTLPARGSSLGLPRDEPVVVYCGHGPRAHLARMALHWHGYRRVVLLEGHLHEWSRAGLPVEPGPDRVA